MSDWGDFGLAGAALGVILSLVTWWVKASREDLKESHKNFIKYVEVQGNRQTEALVSSANANQQSTRALEHLADMITKHDDRAAFRHEVIIGELRKVYEEVNHSNAKS